MHDLASGHEHVFVKDSTRLGWSCAHPGCDLFKRAAEFDDVKVLGGGSRGPAAA